MRYPRSDETIRCECGWAGIGNYNDPCPSCGSRVRKAAPSEPLFNMRSRRKEVELPIEDMPQACPDCKRTDTVQRTDKAGLTAEQAGCRWWCEDCDLVFGRPDEPAQRRRDA